LIFASALRRWVLRLLGFMIVFHSLWWVGDANTWALGGLKIFMEFGLPWFLEGVSGVWRTASGGWMLGTSISGAGTGSLGVFIDGLLLAKGVAWMPTALALVAATTPLNLLRIASALPIAFVSAAVLTVISAAANLALIVNPNPTIWSNGIARPLIGGLSMSPYPDWYFFLVTLGLYFNLNVAALVMPVVVWVILCRREITPLFAAARPG